MDEQFFQLAGQLYIEPRYAAAGEESLHHYGSVLRSLLAQGRCPEVGLSDTEIELLLHQLALMDTNNFARHVGGGEREGRVVCPLVRRRNYNLTHGVGRSGDLTSEQPKAAGSSLLYKLTNAMVLDAVRLAGARSTTEALVVPMATGMTLALVLQAVRRRREKEVQQQQQQETANDGAAPVTTPRYVLWPRIDQKTALKCIEAAGLVPVPVALRPAPLLSLGPGAGGQAAHPHYLQCAVEDLEAAMARVGGPSAVAAVLSTTSCFAPRLPDPVVAIAQLCERVGVPHVINNAYGLQSNAHLPESVEDSKNNKNIMSMVEAAQTLGRVDAFVQSTDKNFLVPVGGAVVCSNYRAPPPPPPPAAAAARPTPAPSPPTTALHYPCVADAAALYAGRASVQPILDLFMTLLHLGRQGLVRLWRERYEVLAVLRPALRAFAAARGEVLVEEIYASPAEPDAKDSASAPAASAATSSHKKKKNVPVRNDISLAVTMQHYGTTSGQEDGSAAQWAAAKAFGARLFRSGVTGPRVIAPAPQVATVISGCTFHNYGMHDEEQEGNAEKKADSDVAAAALVGPVTQKRAPMLIVACGIGMEHKEVTELMRRLEKLWPVTAAAPASV